MVGTGRAAQLGVLVRDAGALEAAGRLDVLVFDKTGTLTAGQPVVEDLALVGDRAGDAHRSDDDGGVPADAPGATPSRGDATARLPAPRTSPALADALAAAVAVEAATGHPLAKALRGEAERRGVVAAEVERGSLSAAVGGVTGTLADGRRVVVGSRAFLEARDVDVSPAAEAGERFAKRGWTLAHVAIDGAVVLVLGIGDQIRPTSTRAVRILTQLGIRPVVSTGDHEASARAVATLAGIDEVHAGESAEGKAARVRDLRAGGHVVGMVGDGTNDAPALAAADAGFAVGSATDLARAAAPLVLVSGDLARATVAVELARATLRVIRQNLGLAFAYNVVAIPLAFTGSVTPPFAAAAMASSSLLVVTNALRLRTFRSRLDTAFGKES